MTAAKLPSRARASEVLASYLPGLEQELRRHSLDELESDGNPGIGLFKQAGGPRILIPDDWGGGGADARQAVYIQYALGALAPSTAVAVTMHQFTVATLVELVRETRSMEAIVIEAVARESLLLASGFAEGRPDGRVLDPTMTLTQDGPSYRLKGIKKPCSLSASMDMITVSVKMPDPSDQFAVALLGSGVEGLRVEPFWRSPVLAGAETGAVVFDGVSIPKAALTYVAPSTDFDRTQLRGYVWFELCIAAAYLGIAAGFIERLPHERADDTALVSMGIEIESAMAMLASAAAHLDDGDANDELLAEALLVRYAVERAIQRATDLALELLGVSMLSGSPELGLVFTASRALSYHPPSRRRAQAGIADFLRGGELVLE